ncbi:hypothetical protein MASR1M60_11300 [Rhodocyclaceae bacterium]
MIYSECLSKQYDPQVVRTSIEIDPGAAASDRGEGDPDHSCKAGVDGEDQGNDSGT